MITLKLSELEYRLTSNTEEYTDGVVNGMLIGVSESDQKVCTTLSFGTQASAVGDVIRYMIAKDPKSDIDLTLVDMVDTIQAALESLYPCPQQQNSCGTKVV
jgi:hypothetical protein